MKKIIPRWLRLAVQRLFRGWDDSETWSLDYSLAKIITPRLKRFRELTCGYPGNETEESWNAKLDAMIEAFEFLASDDRWLDDDKEQWDKTQKGLKLFAKYYCALWW